KPAMAKSVSIRPFGIFCPPVNAFKGHHPFDQP
ncbi:hypothetical protein D049_3922B, partial [Vibrio parahaemolyticus VPTS-2010]